MVARKTTRKKDNTVSKGVGLGVGGVGGAAAGAAVGSLAGPVGTAVGAVIGGAAGAFAGKEIAEAIDPDEEEVYWEKEYPNRPYYTEEVEFDEIRPAYRYGVATAAKHPDKSFEEVESRMSRAWPKSRGDSSLTWSHARDAARDAYERTLQLHEERLKVDKEQVETGEVSVRKETVSERQKIDVPVEREEVVITRRPARGSARKGELGDGKSEEIRIPVKEERVRVSKETVPTEEVSVGRRKVRDVRHIDETIHRERVRTEEKGKAKVRHEGDGARKR